MSSKKKPKEETLTDLEVAQKLIKLSQSAKDRGIDFNLSIKKLKQLLTVKSCYYTGTRFTQEGVNARSIDRVDSDKGYADNNVVACTVDINGKKANLTRKQIEMLYFKLRNWDSLNHKK